MRFFHDVVLAYDGTDCLIWPYYRSSGGYAKMWMDGRLTIVSRLACETEHGPPPTPKHEAAHSCGKGREGCVSRHHLRWATRAENGQDMVRHGTSVRGERCATAKLTEAKVRFAREMRGRMTQADIAARIGVARTTISNIQARKRWAWLADK